MQEYQTERKKLQETEAYEEEVCKYNSLVELLAHPVLELCTVIFDMPSEFNIPRIVARIFDAYEQSIPLLKELIKRSPGFVGNQIQPLFQHNKAAAALLRQWIFLYQEDMHNLLFKNIVECIVYSPEIYDPSEEETLINLTKLVTDTISNWPQQVSGIPRFIVCISGMLYEHFDNIRCVASLFFYYVIDPALKEPHNYKLCDKQFVTPVVQKVLQAAAKFIEYAMFSQKYSIEDFCATLNQQLEYAIPLVSNFLKAFIQQSRLYEQVVDIDFAIKNELPTIEKFLSDNYHQVSLSLLERNSRDKVISLSDALASLKRMEDEKLEIPRPAPELERPKAAIVLSNIKFCGELASKAEAGSPYRKSARRNTQSITIDTTLKRTSTSIGGSTPSPKLPSSNSSHNLTSSPLSPTHNTLSRHGTSSPLFAPNVARNPPPSPFLNSPPKQSTNVPQNPPPVIDTQSRESPLFSSESNDSPVLSRTDRNRSNVRPSLPPNLVSNVSASNNSSEEDSPLFNSVPSPNSLEKSSENVIQRDWQRLPPPNVDNRLKKVFKSQPVPEKEPIKFAKKKMIKMGQKKAPKPSTISSDQVDHEENKLFLNHPPNVVQKPANDNTRPLSNPKTVWANPKLSRTSGQFEEEEEETSSQVPFKLAPKKTAPKKPLPAPKKVLPQPRKSVGVSDLN